MYTLHTQVKVNSIPENFTGIVEYCSGTKDWYVNGKQHRIDGPACEYYDGSREWWVDGKLHRLDGPAVERSDGTNIWYVGGKCHREDGPAVENSDGTKFWWFDGKLVTKLEHKKLSTKPSCEGAVVVVEGKKYKLVAID